MTTFTREFIEKLGFECRNASFQNKAYLTKKLKYFFEHWEGLDSLDLTEWVGDKKDLSTWDEELNRELDCIFAKEWMIKDMDELDKELNDPEY